RGPQFEEALVVADLNLPEASMSVALGDSPADAHDGTVMTIHRVAVPASAPPPAHLAHPAPLDPSGPGPVWPRLDPLAAVYAAVVTGVRDYVLKNRFRSVI